MNFTYCPKCGHKGTVKQHNNTDYECVSCQWHFWNNAKAAVIGIFMRDDGQILTVLRGREPQIGKYDLPGGFTDYSETAEQAMARESMEELGVTPLDMTILGTASNIYVPGVSTCDIVFLVRKWEGEPKINDAAEITAIEWKPIDILENDDFAWKDHYEGFVERVRSHYNTPHELSRG